MLRPREPERLLPARPMGLGDRNYYACRVRYTTGTVQRLLQHCRRLPEAAILNRRPLRAGVVRDEPLRACCVRDHNAPTRGSQWARVGHTQSSVVQNTRRAAGKCAAHTMRSAHAVRHWPSKGIAADGYSNTSAPASNLYSPYLSIECIAALDACSSIAAPDAELSGRPAADRG